MMHERLNVWSVSELRGVWPPLATDDRREGFILLSQGDAEECFLSVNALDQAELLLALPPVNVACGWTLMGWTAPLT